MPTYEYLCDACGHRFELFQSMTAPVKRKCPECGALKLQRLVGAGAGIIFKGGGFYQTDYRSDSYQKAAEAEKKGAAGGTDKPAEKSAKGDSAADSKPATEALSDSKPSPGEAQSSPSSVKPRPARDGGTARSSGKKKAASRRRG